MPTNRDKNGLESLIKKENDYIMDLLHKFNVPNSIEDTQCDNYLLPDNTEVSKKGNVQKEISIDDLQNRLETIKNKLKAKKRPTSKKSLAKRESRKLKKNKEFKKIIVSATKSMKNEQQKFAKTSEKEGDTENTIKPIDMKPVFNGEAKLVFSKFDFSAHTGAKVKKSHQNAREILKKIKDTDKKINELEEKGETEKAVQLKNELVWKKAFDRVEGKKVKDDVVLLHKSLKKRKKEKTKSKEEWRERNKMVEASINQRQKKRQENINKRIRENKTRKMKKMSKKGRIIPGF